MKIIEQLINDEPLPFYGTNQSEDAFVRHIADVVQRTGDKTLHVRERLRDLWGKANSNQITITNSREAYELLAERHPNKQWVHITPVDTVIDNKRKILQAISSNIDIHTHVRSMIENIINAFLLPGKSSTVLPTKVDGVYVERDRSIMPIVYQVKQNIAHLNILINMYNHLFDDK